MTLRERLYYRFRGHAARVKAVECAAQVLSTRKDSEALTPLAFNLCVFFESYILYGANYCAEDFGPKEPVELKPI
jgi:hypothetical protein